MVSLRSPGGKHPTYPELRELPRRAIFVKQSFCTPSRISSRFPRALFKPDTADPLAGSDTYVSDLKFTFLQPVTDISFGMASFRGGGYHYTATDAAGDLIFGNGGNPNAGVTLQFGFLPFSIDLPSGYYFTDFHIGNGDYTTANGAVWVDDISFTTAGGTPRFVDLGDPVPDQASTFLLLSLAALALYGSKRLGLLHS